MALLQAWQHIFSNVEKEQSPHNRDGFQTLFYSNSALGASEVEELEGRMLYFSAEIEPVKQVFLLTSGKRVVSQLVPLSQADQPERQGRYLAHSYIFGPSVMASLNDNPFPIFKQAPFITTVTDAMEQGDFETGNIEAKALSIGLPSQPNMVSATDGWSKAELKKLTLIALRNKIMAQERRAVVIVGLPEAVSKTIEAAFFGVPTPLRGGCSFDTYFYRCNLAATYFWGIGLTSRPNNPTFDQIDASAKQVQQIADPHPQTAYEHWVTNQIEAGHLVPIATLRDAVFPLCRWLDGGTEDFRLLNGLDRDIIKTVFQSNSAVVQKLTRQKLALRVRPELVDRLFPAVFDSNNQNSNFDHLQNGFTLGQLLDILYHLYSSRNFQRPDDSEIIALGTAISKVPNHPLAPLQIIWSGNQPQLRKHLTTLTPEAYQSFVRIALTNNLTAPLDLLIEDQAASFLDEFLRSNAATQIRLLDLIESLVEFNQLPQLERLAKLVSTQSASDIRRIAKILKNAEDVPATFQTSLDHCLTNLPDTIGTKVMKTLKNPLGFLSSHDEE